MSSRMTENSIPIMQRVCEVNYSYCIEISTLSANSCDYKYVYYKLYVIILLEECVKMYSETATQGVKRS